jgi:hypothetical protein
MFFEVMGLPNHMQLTGTRLSDPASKWYRGARLAAKEIRKEMPT